MAKLIFDSAVLILIISCHRKRAYSMNALCMLATTNTSWP